MKKVFAENKVMDEERALYGLADVRLSGCRFEGPADGESALKECGSAVCRDCFFDLRYPLWHDKKVKLEDCELTENCRAALWYSQNITIKSSRLLGIKALRECKKAELDGCVVSSPEFGWFSSDIDIKDTEIVSEYLFLRAKRIKADGLKFKGKYSFQYVKDAYIKNSTLDTKDAFWHSKDVTVENCVVKGEYLGWFSKNLTFKNCKIIGTQPLCYCKDLTLIDCEMIDTDLSFERSHVHATLTCDIVSIKNPLSGRIVVPGAGEIIKDIKGVECEIIVDPSVRRSE